VALFTLIRKLGFDAIERIKENGVVVAMAWEIISLEIILKEW
jgi:hypothetical protein